MTSCPIFNPYALKLSDWAVFSVSSEPELEAAIAGWLKYSAGQLVKLVFKDLKCHDHTCNKLISASDQS